VEHARALRDRLEPSEVRYGIGKGSFIAARAVVIKDVPERTLVVGTPGRNQPLPASLDRENDRALTLQPLDIWHPRIPDLSIWKFPPYWPQEKQEAAVVSHNA
jgi:hypothetical protein